MTFRKMWKIICHGENGDCSNDASPNIEMDGKFYCDRHLREKRNAKYKPSA
jgi:hypothetical protein